MKKLLMLPLCAYLLAFMMFACKRETEILTPAIQETATDNARIAATLSTVFTISEQPTGLKEAARLAQSTPATDFSPTGFYAQPNKPLTIIVKKLAGTRLPVLLVGTYSRYSARWNPASYQLVVGTNTITDTEGGLLYLRYRTDDTPNSKAEVTFTTGQVQAPYYVLGKTTPAQWKTMLSTTTAPDVVLEGERAIIVASLSKALLYKDENQTQLLKTADQVIATEDKISGLDGTTAADKINVHKYLLTETDDPGTYMAATYYRTFFNTSVVSSILTVKDLKSWGPWHELGHMHQQTKWTWSALGEVTVNVYSLAVERSYGTTYSRLHRDGVWANAKTFLALPEAQRDFNGSNASVWVRLCVFQQLWLAYGDNFYVKLHKKTRTNTETISTDAAKMGYFMKTACQVSGNDLTEFFKKWGFKADAATFSAIAAMKLPKPTKDLTLLAD